MDLDLKISDIGDVFDLGGKLLLGGATGGLSLAAEGMKSPTPGKPPVNPENDPKAIAERDRKAREEALRRLLGGMDSNIQTSPLGLVESATVRTQSLLGS